MTRADRRRFPILLAATAALLVFIAVNAASSPVQAQDPSADASLSSLSLSDSLGADIELSPEFSAEVTSYTADDVVESSVSSTTVAAETTDDNATAVIRVNGVEDADGAVDLVGGYNDITVEVTAQDGTTKETYTVTVLRAQPEDTSTSTDDTITSLLSRLDVKLTENVLNNYHTQIAGYISDDPDRDADPRGSLSPAGFNYPAGFGPWYTIELLLIVQEGAPNAIGVDLLELEVRGAVTSVTGTEKDKAHVLPADADINLHLEGDDFTWSASLDVGNRTNDACIEKDGLTKRLCRVGVFPPECKAPVGAKMGSWKEMLT